MSEVLDVTRRGLLQMVAAVITTASFASRRPLFGSIPESIESPAMEVVEDEPFIRDLAHGTRLERFLRSRGIKPAHLARESGYSRQFLLRLRLGRVDATTRCVAGIVRACQRLAREPVHARDLFDLSPFKPACHRVHAGAASSISTRSEHAMHALSFHDLSNGFKRGGDLRRCGGRVR